MKANGYYLHFSMWCLTVQKEVHHCHQQEPLLEDGCRYSLAM